MIIKNISKQIQEYLKAKEIAMSRRPPDPNDTSLPPLSFSDLATRTTFVRMVSNKLDPVVLGDVKSYSPIYGEGGSQTINPDTLQPVIEEKNHFGYSNIYTKRQNGQIRGISGIKNISVEYQGGYKGIRKATVNWVANSLDDLDLYEPHFLTIGKSVLLEWGWVYKDRNKNVNKTFYQNRVVDQKAFTEPMDIILENGGVMDAVGGVVSNFDYKLNEDGGFDCNTIITSVGINFMGSQKIAEQSDSYRIISNEADDTRDVEYVEDSLLNAVLNLPRIIVHNYFGVLKSTSSSTLVAEMLRVPFDGKLTKPAENAGLLLDSAKIPGWSTRYNSLVKKDQIHHDALFSFFNSSDSKDRMDFFVRWGWFEDNILSRYTAYEVKEGEMVGYFRSIEKNDQTSEFMPVRIRNSPDLYPIDPIKFFLPGQTNFFNSFRIKEGKNFAQERYVPGIKKHFENLSSINSKNDFRFDDVNSAEDYKYGVLRNIMVSVKEIQKAFGIDVDKVGYNNDRGYIYGTTVINPPETLDAAMKNLLSSLNANFHNYWDFRIAEDPYTKHKKIIDVHSTANMDGAKHYTTFNKLGKVADDAENSNNRGLGIYKFPSFKLESIVKSQQLDFKVPNSMAVAAMYGSNYNKDTQFIQTSDNSVAGLNVLSSNDTGDKYDDLGYENIREEFTKTKLDNSGFKKPHKIGTSNDPSGSSYKVKLDKDNSFGIQVDSTNSVWWHKFSLSKDDNNNQQEKTENDAKKSSFRKDLQVGNQQLTGSTYYEISVEEKSSESQIKLFSAGVSVLTKQLYNINKSNSKYQSDFLLPAELSLEIDGTGGITPGDVFQVDYISPKYNKEIVVSGSNEKLGPKTFFQAFNITQTVDENGWNTSIETKMRVNSEALNAVPLPEEPEIWDPIITDAEFKRIREETDEFADRGISTDFRNEIRAYMNREDPIDNSSEILNELNKFQEGEDPNYNKIPDINLRILGLLDYKNELIKRNRRIREREEELNRRVEEEENKSKKLIETFIKLDTDDGKDPEVRKKNENDGKPKLKDEKKKIPDPIDKTKKKIKDNSKKDEIPKEKKYRYYFDGEFKLVPAYKLTKSNENPYYQKVLEFHQNTDTWGDPTVKNLPLSTTTSGGDNSFFYTIDDQKYILYMYYILEYKIKNTIDFQVYPGSKKGDGPSVYSFSLGTLARKLSKEGKADIKQKLGRKVEV